MAGRVNNLDLPIDDYRGGKSTLCPGCGHDAISSVIINAAWQNAIPPEGLVKMSGIGCSSKTPAYFLSQSHGFNTAHGRMPSVTTGANVANKNLNFLAVSGDGDTASIGIGQFIHAIRRNLNMLYIIENNGVYGLTKGQSSPTAQEGMITSSTPYGKPEVNVNALKYYLTVGVSFVASGISNKIKDLANLIHQGMEHPGFSVIHVQSPCTVYNNTYEQLKGNPRKGIEPMAWAIQANHDKNDIEAAVEVVNQGGVPLGVIYEDKNSIPLENRMAAMFSKAHPKTPQELMDAYLV